MIVVVDNYDSFTFNLVHDLGLLGAETRVIRNDAMPVDAVMALRPAGIVISPGPCDPPRAGSSVAIAQAAAAARLPLLGVCLGCQSIGYGRGARVVRAPAPVHGKTDRMKHDGRGVFAGLPNPFIATRYHSLIVARDSVPDGLEICAETEDGLVMGLRDPATNAHGVQFHPESVATPDGRHLLGNFLGLCGVDWRRAAADAPERAAAA
ncbi:MAG: aminodeoxychorismate/anthranilate synthase component II [Pseudomonadota bacterium]